MQQIVFQAPYNLIIDGLNENSASDLFNNNLENSWSP